MPSKTRGCLVPCSPAKIEDKRRYPRVTPFQAVKLVLVDGTEIPGAVVDISPDGMRLQCSATDARKIYPSGKPITDDNRPLIEFRLMLPLAGGEKAAMARCYLAYVHATKNGEISFGCEFAQTNLESGRLFARFFRESLEPA